jgi:hypothetical protein
LNAEQNKVFRNEHSYQERMLFADENTKQKRTIGIDCGLLASHNFGAEGQRSEIFYS